MPPRPCNTQALQALDKKSGGSRGNTLSLSKTLCAGERKLLCLPSAFPARLSRSASCSFCGSRSLWAGSSGESPCKAGNSLPKGKSLPRAKPVRGLQHASFCSQLCREAFEAYGWCQSAQQVSGAVQGAPQMLG